MFETLPLDYKLSVPCGKCVECRKALARDWRARLLLEVDYWTKQKKKCYFVTFTLADDAYDYWTANPEKPVRLFLENYRRKVGRSCKHFLITELGKETHRLHYHGILFGPELSLKELKKLWIYGFSFFGYCSYRTAKYVSKYILKPQLEEAWYKPKKFVSPGLGKHYLNTDIARFKSVNSDVNDMYVYIDGFKYPMPRYLRNKLYSDDFLRGVQYDRYFKNFDKVEFLESLRVGKTYCQCVEDFLRIRKYVLDDSIRRKASTPLSPPKNFVSDIKVNMEFLPLEPYEDWELSVNDLTPF